jgi:NADH-quinone oxidoreductase subunit C
VSQLSSPEGTPPADEAAAPEDTAPAADAPAPEPEPEPEPDPRQLDPERDALLSQLEARLGEALVDWHLSPGKELWVRVATDSWVEAGQTCHDLGLTYFCFVSAIDWMPSPYGRSEDAAVDETDTDAAPAAAVEQGVCGGETRMQVFARLASVAAPHLSVILKADVDDTDPRVGSWARLYRGADWHERETAEMFGIVFEGHPYLENIYLPGGFEGHPLRKDFPLLAREVKPWPGIVDVEAMPGEDDPDDKAPEEAGAS